MSLALLPLLIAGGQPLRGAEPSAVTAIDILLEPDAVMVEHAQAANARLLKSYPNGFALDEAHHPHVTCLQRYVRTGDLDKVYAAVGKVLAGEKPAAWKLRTDKYYYLAWDDDLGLAGIVVEPTDELIRFQQKLVDAVAPFTVQTGTAAAYVTTPEEPEVNQQTFDYVAGYVPERTGAKFNPHATIGLAQREYLDKLLAEKFEPFRFSPVGVAVYHLGNNGTARVKLKGWELE